MKDTVGRKNGNGNGNKKSKESYQEGKEGTFNSSNKCKTCGEMHKGECWEKVGKLDSMKSKHNSNPNKRKWMNKEIVAMMKTALQQQDDTKSDASGKEESWKKLAKSKAEVATRMRMISAWILQLPRNT